LRFVEPWLLAFVNPDAKQGRCQPVMVCYALLGKTREKWQSLPLQKTSGSARWMHLQNLSLTGTASGDFWL